MRSGFLKRRRFGSHLQRPRLFSVILITTKSGKFPARRPRHHNLICLLGVQPGWPRLITRLLLGQDRRPVRLLGASTHAAHQGPLPGVMGAPQRQGESGAALGSSPTAATASGEPLYTSLRLVQLPLRRHPPDLGSGINIKRGSSKGAFVHGQQPLHYQRRASTNCCRHVPSRTTSARSCPPRSGRD